MDRPTENLHVHIFEQLARIGVQSFHQFRLARGTLPGSNRLRWSLPTGAAPIRIGGRDLIEPAITGLRFLWIEPTQHVVKRTVLEHQHDQRLNGPADSANSSCMSCHMTASVVDKNGKTPPIIAQFQPAPKITQECVTPNPNFPSQGQDAAGSPAQQVFATFAELDQLFFDNTAAGVPINMSVAGYNILRSSNGDA